MKMLWSVAFDVYLEQSCVLHFLTQRFISSLHYYAGHHYWYSIVYGTLYMNQLSIHLYI